jgi:hypothetical protein
MYDHKTVVGHVTIAEPYEYVDRGYETASWYRTYDVHPGTYEIVATFAGKPEPGRSPYWLMVRAEATITDEHFPSSFFGNQFGELRKPNVGKVETVSLGQYYGYDAGKLGAWLKGTVEWLPGWSLHCWSGTSFDREYHYCGKLVMDGLFPFSRIKEAKEL